MKMHLASFCAITCIAFLLPLTNAKWLKANQADPEDELFKNYNALRPPTVNGEAVNVSISLQINQFLHISEADETFQINCHLKQRWTDTRINFPKDNDADTIILHASLSDNLWRPSTFFFNAIEGKDLRLLSSPHFYEITRNGSVTMSSRMIVKLTCSMDLTYYPHDKQICYVHLESLSDLVNEVNYHWDGFNVLKHRKFHGWQIDSLETTNLCHLEENDSNGHTCAQAKFLMKRQIGHYLIRLYGPSLLIVITTFIGFWIPAQAYPAWILIVVLPLLALVTQESQASNELTVSYVIELDVWYMTCLFFTFMALLELAAALIYIHVIEDAKEKSTKQNAISKSDVTDTTSIADSEKSDGLVMKTSKIHNATISPRKQSLPARLFMRHSSYDLESECGTQKDAQHNTHSHNSHHHHHNLQKHVSHAVKQILNHVYGDIDWRKAPGVRNKVDYCSRILFPVCFSVFCVSYFVALIR